MGILEIRVTDPPHPAFSSIVVSIDPLESIKVHKVVPGEPGEWIDVPLAVVDNQVVSSFDLVTLVGVTETLVAVETAAGSFTQIRLYIDTVMVTPEGGEPQPATLPSGILRIVRPFGVQEGLRTVLTLDFDGDRSIVTTGRGRFIFKPVVRLLIETESLPAAGGDTTPPTITLTGVVEGQIIVSPETVIPVFSASDDTDPSPTVTATLNGDEFTSGTEVSEVGEYELIVTAIDASDNEAELAVNFEIVEVEDTTPPEITITGVSDGQEVTSPETVTPVFTASDDIDLNPIVVATLNGDEFASGTEVSEVGVYELIVTAIDASDNEAEVLVNFEIVEE
jgi:outer membrane lipoprotein-sorting protein